VMVAHGEEFGKTLGVILFIEAMTRYLTDAFGWDGVLRFAVGAPRPADATYLSAGAHGAHSR
jgi:hypothetical protein